MYCDWDCASEEERAYHDTEWGVPLHDDRRQFEFLSMEVMQCGLSWGLVMKKREILRACFDRFDFDRVAEYGEEDLQRILETPGMIRAPRKVRAVIGNARCVQAVRAECGSFSDFLWDFCGGKTILYTHHADGWIPASNGLSDALSRELKRRGFSYVDPVTIYSHLQACGIINDHGRDCPCYRRINAACPTVERRRRLEKNVRFYA